MPNVSRDHPGASRADAGRAARPRAAARAGRHLDHGPRGWRWAAARPPARGDRVRRGDLGSRRRPARRASPGGHPRPARAGRVRSGRPARRRDVRGVVRGTAPADLRRAAGAGRALARREPRRPLRGPPRRAPGAARDLRGTGGRALPDAGRAARDGDPVRAAADRAQRGALRALGVPRPRSRARARRRVARGLRGVLAGPRARPTRQAHDEPADQERHEAGPRCELERIAVPASLLWGRHDRFVPLALGEAASRRLGWPLHVVEDAGHVPHVEQSEAFLEALS